MYTVESIHLGADDNTMFFRFNVPQPQQMYASVADILRNVTYQVVMKADIAVYPNTRVIELRYHGN